MTRRPRHLAIIIFPYLFIYENEGITIDSINLKPSREENVDGEKEDTKYQLLNIAKLFRFGRNEQISHWSYALAYISNSKQWNILRDKLNEISAVLRYSHLCDLKENSRFDHFNYFVFEITGAQLKRDGDLLFYEGILNGESTYNFHLSNGETDHPFIAHTEIHPLVLTADEIKNNNYFQTFYVHRKLIFKGDEDRRILRAIEWFNRSYSHYGRGVDLSEAVLNVHTAIESLLRPEEEERSVKAQIKTALLNILGHSKELSSWFDKFWKLRNSIVHGDIKPEPLLYTHPEGKKGHRNHLYIARKIFVRSLEIILKIRAEFPLMGLEEELISNEVRIHKAIKLLRKHNRSNLEQLYNARVFDFISGLRNDEASANKNNTKQLGELFLPFIRKDIEDNETEGVKRSLISMIDSILGWQGSNLRELALLYSKLEQSYDSVYFKKIIDFPVYILALRGAAYTFFRFATWRLLTWFD